MTRTLLLLIALGGATVFAQQLAPNAPKDKPVSAETNAALEKFDRAIAPHVAEARKTWPGAKKRYLAGLPKNEPFFVTVRLKEGREFEQCFVLVKSIKDGKISGAVASQMMRLRNLKRGDAVVVNEAEIYDWMIAKPDGSEEGNVVGKFLDTYQP